jgi:TolB protein
MAASLLVWIVAACGSDGAVSPAQPGRHLIIEGRLERGLAVRIAAAGERDTVAVPGSAISTTPASNANVSGDSVTLTNAGALHIDATVDGARLALDTVVAAPPMIVFDAIAQGNRDIYKIAIDGGELARLTTSPGEDMHPSAAGGVVVFTSFRDGNGELYQVHSDGSAEVRLSTTSQNETLPALSPNGKTIAYLNDATTFGRIWLASATFGNPTVLIPTTPSNASDLQSAVAWSPTSDRLVFVSTSTPSGGAGLFVIPATPGATPMRLAGSGDHGPEVEPSWSAVGDRIVYASARRDTTTIFVRDLSSGVETQVLHGFKNVGQPAWLPDGRIVFTDFSGPRLALAWVDPAFPTVVHAIATPGLASEHAAPLSPR